MRLIYKLIKDYPGCLDHPGIERIIDPNFYNTTTPFHQYRCYYRLIGVMSDDTFRIYDGTKIKLLKMIKCINKGSEERVVKITHTVYNGKFRIDFKNNFWLITDITNVKIPIYQNLPENNCSEITCFDKLFFKEEACQEYFNTLNF